jgi:hypothetical protein
MLKQRVEAVPRGGGIDWATYYFRDRALAQALIDASDRGVKVNLHVEGRPRRASVNGQVLAMLSAHGLGGGLHVHRPGKLLPKLHPHLHTKIYAFSHPEPVALLGSFNPSGDIPEDPDIIEEIGDQDRGHNLLVAYRDLPIVDGLRGHVRGLGGSRDRFRAGRTIASGPVTLYFYPRLRTGIIDRQIAPLGQGSRIVGAISHLKQGSLSAGLAAASRRGAAVELIVHDTERRVPEAAIELLRKSGVVVSRYARPDALPLHAKFLLVEAPAGRTAWFGSFNFNPRSRYLNHELLVRSAEADLWDGLYRRYLEIAAETGG